MQVFGLKCYILMYYKQHKRYIMADYQVFTSNNYQRIIIHINFEF